jgi:hypothetical protein
LLVCAQQFLIAAIFISHARILSRNRLGRTISWGAGRQNAGGYHSRDGSREDTEFELLGSHTAPPLNSDTELGSHAFTKKRTIGR